MSYGLNQTKKQFIQQARENINDGSWLPWHEALNVKEGDVITLTHRDYESVKHGFVIKKRKIEVSSIEKRDTDFGFSEIHYCGKILTGGAVSGVLSENVPMEDEKTDSSKVKTLYEDGHVTFDTYDGKYRVTFFNDEFHWHGEIVMNENGVIYDSVKEP